MAMINYVGMLQEFCQKHEEYGLPKYSDLKLSGPKHCPDIEMECTVEIHMKINSILITKKIKKSSMNSKAVKQLLAKEMYEDISSRASRDKNGFVASQDQVDVAQVAVAEQASSSSGAPVAVAEQASSSSGAPVAVAEQLSSSSGAPVAVAEQASSSSTVPKTVTIKLSEILNYIESIEQSCTKPTSCVNKVNPVVYLKEKESSEERPSCSKKNTSPVETLTPTCSESKLEVQPTTSGGSGVPTVPVEDVFVEGTNYVGKLQEFCQRKGRKPPLYNILKQEGGQHNPTFEMECVVGDVKTSLTLACKQKLLRQKLAYEMSKIIMKNQVVPPNTTKLQHFFETQVLDTSKEETPEEKEKNALSEIVTMTQVPETTNVYLHIKIGNETVAFPGVGATVPESQYAAILLLRSYLADLQKIKDETKSKNPDPDPKS